MRLINSKFFQSRFLSALLNCGVSPSDTVKERLDKQVLTLLPVIIGIAAAIWGTIYLLLGHTLSASIPLSYALISFFSLLHFSYTKSPRFLQVSQLVLVLVLPFLLMWSLGGFAAGSYVMIWAFYAPLAALPSSTRSGVIWFALFMLLVAVSTLIDATLQEQVRAMPELAITIFSWLNVTAGFGGIFYIMLHYITERDNISSDLRTLNADLESKIEAAVVENERNNRIIQQQSKLANMGEMVAMIAHQWRQPLNTISAASGALELKIAMDKYDKAFFSSNLATISSFSQHLSETIEDFRNFFKPDKQKTHFTLRKVLESAINLNEALFANAHVTLEKDFETEGRVMNYENEIIQVLMNILKNAFDALHEQDVREPKVHISLREKAPDRVLISICDNAGGISKEVMEKMYDPYFSTKSIQGTGLGLYMSKIIIEEHCNGRLSCYNSAEGACFTIEFEQDNGSGR